MKLFGGFNSKQFIRPLSFILPPSSFPFVPLATPYWNGDTYCAILRALLHAHFIEGPDLYSLKASLIERLGVEDAKLCGSGSLALELALRACGVRAGDEVIIPAFCCSAVVPPIVALEAVPVLADVGADLNLTADTVGAAMTRKTKAIIVPHLFGNPADIGSIVELAHAKNIRVIDDAAQALGATFGGRPLGSFGDAGIVSFGNEKICFGLGGGALVTKRSPVLVDSPQRLASAEIAPVLKQLAATQFAWRWRRWTLPIQKLIERDVDDGPATPPAPYRPEAMGNLQAAVALNLMRSLDENLAARRARVNRYREMLGDEPGLELLPHRTGSACLTQVVRIRPQRRDQDSTAVLIATVRSRGYEVQGSYVPIHLLACFKQCVWDALPQTERIWADLIELPCEPSVSLSEVERISSLVKSFCRSDTATRRVKARPLSRLGRMDCAN